MTTTISIPTLQTDHLVLRCPHPSDFEAYAAFRASDRALHVGGPNKRYQSYDILCAIIGHWHLRGYGRWTVADKATQDPLGIVGLMFPDDWPEPEIAWSVYETAEGRGVALEAAKAARAYAYDTLGWTRVISCIAPGNHRSRALAQRMGAVHESTMDHVEIGALEIHRHLSPQELA